MGNKADLEDKRKVNYEEAEEVCKSKKIFWGGECSVQDMSIDELNEKFCEFVKEIYKTIGTGEDNKPVIVKKLSTGKKEKKKNNRNACC